MCRDYDGIKYYYRSFLKGKSLVPSAFRKHWMAGKIKWERLSWWGKNGTVEARPGALEILSPEEMRRQAGLWEIEVTNWWLAVGIWVHVCVLFDLQSFTKT